MSSIDNSSTRDSVSWILTSILIATIFINLIYTLFQFSVKLIRRLRYKRLLKMRQESYKERQSQLKESALAQGAKTRVKVDLLFENVTQVQKNLIAH